MNKHTVQRSLVTGNYYSVLYEGWSYESSRWNTTSHHTFLWMQRCLH